MGEIGDGWLPWYNTLETFVERKKKIDEVAPTSGRAPQDIEKAVVIHLALTDNKEHQKTVL